MEPPPSSASYVSGPSAYVTSRHLEQVMADLRIHPFFSLPGNSS